MMKSKIKFIKFICIAMLTSIAMVSCEDDYEPRPDTSEIEALITNQTGSTLKTSGIETEEYDLVKEFLFVRGTGKPLTTTFDINLDDASDSVIVKLVNGPIGFSRCSSAEMILNGVQILTENQLNQEVAAIEFKTLFNNENTIEAILYGAPNSAIQVMIYRKSKSFDLIAYYPFNGNALDESGNGWDGKESAIF